MLERASTGNMLILPVVLIGSGQAIMRGDYVTILPLLVVILVIILMATLMGYLSTTKTFIHISFPHQGGTVTIGV